MNRLLTTLMIALMLVTTASAIPVDPAPQRGQQRGVRLTPEQQKTILAVQPWLANRGKNNVRSSKTRTAALKDSRSALNSPEKVNASGSRIQGWRSTEAYSSSPRGWYELGIDGSENLLWEYHDPDWVDDGWSDEPDFPFNAGFWRNGKVYGFHAEMLIYWLVWGHGTFTLDGQISDYVTFGEDLDLQDFSTYVLSCAYDSDNDKVYAYTLNSDASAYMLQSMDPETWEFTPINTNVMMEDICIGFCYNPVDKKLYGMTPDSRLVTLDTATGNLTKVAKYNLPATTSVEGMTYSPLDNLFFFVYSDGEDYAVLYTIDPKDYSLEKRSELEETMQYRILITPDKLLSPKTPLVPQIVSMDFAKGSVSGTATLLMPTETFDGSKLSGALKLRAYVDGELKAEVNGQPDGTVTVSLNDIAEGKRRFTFTVVGNDLESAETEQTLFIGYDTPKAPQNINLEEGKLTWDAVIEGINEGYIDTDALTYNVYLNDKKINDLPITDTEYTFDMPSETFRKYIAQVETENHGHLSDRGFSNDIKAGNPFPLPFSITPTETESELVKAVSNTTNPYRNWYFSGDEEGNYFRCNTTSFDGPADKWIFMPGVKISQSDLLVEVSFEYRCLGYENNEENLTVGYADTQNPEAFKIVKAFNGLRNEDWVKATVWCCPDDAVSYIGFKTTADETGNTIQIRNISISMSERPASTPAQVENLSVAPMPKGELKANVKFSLPSLDMAGNALGDASLNATVKCGEITKNFSGAPGAAMDVEIPTSDGFNTIIVSADNSAKGIETSATVFTGVDVPVALNDIKVSHSEDYKGIHLEWNAPDKGVNGGYVDPSKVSYALCLYNPEEMTWEINKEIGTTTSYDYYPVLNADTLIMAEYAILTLNDKGNCGTVRVANTPVGKPYSLPIAEIYNENEFEPKYIDNPDDTYTNAWGFVQSAYPYWVSTPTPYGDSAYVAMGNTGEKSRIVLPAFSTEGVESAGIEIPVWCGPSSAGINVYAEAYGMKPELIGSFRDDSEEGWTKKRFQLPSQFIGKKWVNISIDAVFDGDYQTAGFAQAKIQTFHSDDISVLSIGAPAFPMVGQPAEISAEIENFGTQTAEAPQMLLEITRGENTVASMTMERVNGEGNLPELAAASYRAVWTPGADAEGNVKFTVRIANPDMNPSNDSKVAEATVGKGNGAVVTDLAASEESEGIVLTWTDPTVETGKESFESMAPFSYGDRIGDFKFYSGDGSECNYFLNFRFPHDIDQKAWQVISEKEITEIIENSGIENTFMKAASGDRFLAAFTPFTYYVGAGLVADRWIISPEVKPGSKFSFMMTPGLTGRIEKIEVLASTTDDNTESFETIEEHQLLTAEWRKYEYTLPEEAKYFAIRYCGNTDDSFFVLVDDIEYVPAAESPVLEGFDIYRDGKLIAEAANVRGSWTDSYKSQDATISYNIKPVVRRNGVLTRGFMSNTATIARSAINEIEEDLDPEAIYFTLQGIRVENPENGVFIKKKGAKVTKVLMK